MRAVLFAAALLGATPASALSFVQAGSFLPQGQYNVLELGFGQGNIYDGNPLGFGPSGIYRVSFTLSALPTTIDFDLFLTEVEREYDEDGNFVSISQQFGQTFGSDAVTLHAAFLHKIPRPYLVDYGWSTVEGSWLSAVYLAATFSQDGVPIDYELRADRIGAVPEPATWTMLIAGFGLVGTTLRRHRRQAGQAC